MSIKLTTSLKKKTSSMAVDAAPGPGLLVYGVPALRLGVHFCRCAHVLCCRSEGAERKRKKATRKPRSTKIFVLVASAEHLGRMAPTVVHPVWVRRRTPPKSQPKSSQRKEARPPTKTQGNERGPSGKFTVSANTRRVDGALYSRRRLPPSTSRPCDPLKNRVSSRVLDPTTRRRAEPLCVAYV
jgi:hypothetical protein